MGNIHRRVHKQPTQPSHFSVGREILVYMGNQMEYVGRPQYSGGLYSNGDYERKNLHL